MILQDESVYRELKEIVESVRIFSPDLFVIKGQFFETSTVVHLLYGLYHCRNESVLQNGVTLGDSNYNDIQDFIETLSRTNTSKRTWEGGWEIVKIENNGQIAVKKNGLILWLWPKDLKMNNDVLEIGKKGQIAMVREYRKLYHGFYMANGNATSDEDYYGNKGTVKFYWHIQKLHAPSLMKYVTNELNTAEIPFKFKILTEPSQYPRADAAVLYLRTKYFSNKCKNCISNIYAKVREFLDSTTPLFAKKLGNGLSVAEEPHDGKESFGQLRSRILAESLFTIKRKNILTATEAIEEISAHFSKMGLDLQRPFLNPNSTDNYDIIVENYDQMEE